MPDDYSHIGILGGSFNPVHIGHTLLADYIACHTDISQVWLMLSPLNPLKESPEALIDDRSRLEMLRIALAGYPRLEACDIELSMPRPSYTIASLRRLSELYPHHRFSLIIGSDNWLIFNQWRCHDEIIRLYSPIIYPRPGYPIDAASLPPEVTLIDAPVIDLSSTALRHDIAQGLDVTDRLPAGVAEYIARHHLYSPTSI